MHWRETGAVYPTSMPVTDVTDEAGVAGREAALHPTDTLERTLTAHAQVDESR